MLESLVSQCSLTNALNTWCSTVGDREVSSIGKGLCVLLGIARDDGPKEAEWM